MCSVSSEEGLVFLDPCERGKGRKEGEAMLGWDASEIRRKMGRETRRTLPIWVYQEEG